ncbi:hypothetical protein HX867_10255 [Pseudomonas gingeri]|uniref:hypothetical protein n=1 Tax=Pseudomonas gingeri TaxID=117681 RepID=UPI0015A2C38B|nr:hypothetical protein [Pseudomonas gingeri]NVZ62464.1 hypothetical protein [Pseudomonas gingeri]NVZ76274.1 hypothetical protein [Pseudomonas gingeri]
MFSALKKTIGYATSLQRTAEKQEKHHDPRKGIANLSRVKNDPRTCTLHKTELVPGKQADSSPVGATGIQARPSRLGELRIAQNQMPLHGQQQALEQQLPASAPLDGHDNSQLQLIGQGSRGRVYRSGDRVIKEVTPFDPQVARHEVDMCNRYWQTANESAAATRVGNCIRMPFVQGTLPDSSETRQGVKSLYDRGLMMGDAHPSNFIKTEKGDIVPVDFGLVFPKDGIEQLHKDVGIEILRDYAKGGFAFIPDAIKPVYIARLQDLDHFLDERSPTKLMNIKVLSKSGLLTHHSPENQLQAPRHEET